MDVHLYAPGLCALFPLPLLYLGSRGRVLGLCISIVLSYPEWLQSHRESLPPEQFEKYQEQHSVMGKICEQFEAETPTDSEATQKARFEKVLDLMQQLQDLGHPPKELAGEMPPGLNFDLDALNLSGPPGANGEQCLIM
ncbi:peroxisomal biogenesis factor 19-like [Carlito syrichta]|uniref:Peroxisomal biogenesis factor 19 n=1 Tax=Carlito syrichta TaxID=1868482 RepID=A0A1U7T746_CARSF|nr:peroxisomal biogenesis factor 19-like [Carlito syrichta]